MQCNARAFFEELTRLTEAAELLQALSKEAQRVEAQRRHVARDVAPYLKASGKRQAKKQAKWPEASQVGEGQETRNTITRRYAATRQPRDSAK